MLFFLSLIPATIAIIIGYFVLFSSTRAEGAIKQFGRYLSAWMFLLAAVVVLGALVAPAVGFRGPLAEMMEHMQRMEQQSDEILKELQEE